jgi:hypothetical protein
MDLSSKFARDFLKYQVADQADKVPNEITEPACVIGIPLSS